MFSAPFKSEFSYLDLLDAYFACRKRKRSKPVCVEFDIDFERGLDKLLLELNTNTYQIMPSRVFVVTHPKPREIWAAQFRDRIVHHLIYNEIGWYYERRFIEDTFSCIKGRGTQAAVQRLEQFCRRITENWSKPAYYLQADISNYFVSISRNLLWKIIKKDLGDMSIVSRITKQVIFNDPTVNAIIKPHTDFSLIPKHKSLWSCKPGFGLPIGNLTSQFMSNVYLDEFDKFVKHTLKVKHYVRYVDDLVMLSKDKDQLQHWYKEANDWLQNHRGNYFHPNKTKLNTISQGINFVGAIIKPFRTYVRNLTVQSAKKIAEQLRKNPCDQEALYSAQSYLGIMRHLDSYNIRKDICESVAVPMILEHDTHMTKIVKCV